MKKLKLVTAILLIALVNCTKEEKFLSGSNSGSPSMTIPQGIPMNNGTQLEFNDQEHFEDWLDYLQNELDQPSNTDDDTLLANIELNELGGFNSLRNSILISSGLIDPDFELDLENFENYKPCDLIGDDVLKSVLNENHEYIIGDMLWVIFPGGHIVGVDRHDSQAINMLSDIDKCSIDIEKFSGIFSDTRFTYSMSTPEGDVTEEDDIYCGYYPVGITNQFAIEIDVPKRLAVTTMKYQFKNSLNLFWPAENKWKPVKDVGIISAMIDMGDGNPAFSFNQNEAFTHTYLTAGTKAIQVTYTFYDLDENVSTTSCTIELEVTLTGCYYLNDFNLPKNKRSNTSNTWFLEYGVFANKINTSGERRAGSWVVGWKWKNSNKYKRKRTKLKTHLYGAERDVVCVPNTYFINLLRISSIKRRKITKGKRDSYVKYNQGNLRSIHELTQEGVLKEDVFSVCL